MSKQSNQRYRKELSKKQSLDNKVSNSNKDETNQNVSDKNMNSAANSSVEERNN